MEDWLSKHYGVQNDRKKGIREFAAVYGKIRMIIGIAKGEEKRVSRAEDHPARWFRESIEMSYPLVDLGMDRAACQDLLHSYGLYVIPSNCVMCPFLGEPELEYIRRFYPEQLNYWIQLEAAKLEKHRDKENVIVTDKDGEVILDKDGNPKTANKNYGVFGVKPLPAMIDVVKAKYASWTDVDIAQYRYSHGHCVMSSY